MFLLGLAAILAGVLASSNIVIEKLPNAKEVLDKMIPYQAIIGLVALILGVLKLFDLPAMATKNTSFSTIIVAVVCVAASVVVGFLLGYPMIQQWILSDEKSKEKGEEIRKKLSGYQVIAGLVAAGSGVYLLIASIF